MLPIFLVIIASILAIIFWHKKINPETSWIYSIYVLIIVILYLSVAINT